MIDGEENKTKKALKQFSKKSLKQFSVYCFSTSTSAVMSMLCSEYGWSMTPDPKKASILWCSEDELNLLLSNAKRYQRFAKIPGMDVSRLSAVFSISALIVSRLRLCATRKCCHAVSTQHNGYSRISSISGQSHGFFLKKVNFFSRPWMKLMQKHLL